MKIFLCWLGLTIIEAFIGNRAEQLSSQGFNKLKDAFVEPRNHDIVKAIAISLFKSLRQFFEQLSVVNQFGSLKDVILDCQQAIESLGDIQPDRAIGEFDNQLIQEVSNFVTPFFARAEYEAEALSREMAEDAIVSGVVSYLQKKSGITDVGLLTRCIRQGYGSGSIDVEPWINSFRKYLSAEIKSNSRFRDILQTEMIAGTYTNSQNLQVTTDSILDILTELTCDAGYSFSRLLKERGQTALLTYESAIDLATRANAQLPVVHLDEHFGLEILNPFEPGAYFGLQESKGRWFADDIPHSPLRLGRQVVPETYLVEADPSDQGNRQYVVLIFDGELPYEVREIMQSTSIGETGMRKLVSILRFFANFSGWKHWGLAPVFRRRTGSLFGSFHSF